MESKIIDMTDTNFSMLLEQYSLIFVDCWASWCIPCLALNPLIDELAEEFNDQILIAKLNVENNPELTQKYEIHGLPAFLVFENGEFLYKYPWMFFSQSPEITIRKAIRDLID